MTLDELKALWGTPEALWTAWDKALESGRFTKGRGSLRDGSNHYCCLGVLNEIAGVAQKAPLTDGGIWSQGGEISHLHPAVAEFLDIVYTARFRNSIQFTDAGPGGQTHVITSLVGLNDNTMATFPDIARVIREQRAAGNFVRWSH